MRDSKFPPRPPKPPSDGGGRTWLPLEPPPPRPPDAVIIPEGQLADVLPDGLVEALEEQGPEVALDPRWKAARDAFLASTGAEWGAYILEELERTIARRNGAKESAKDLRQNVLLVLSRRYAQHVTRTGEAWKLDHPKAYLRSVCENVARDHAKSKSEEAGDRARRRGGRDVRRRARPGGGGAPRRAPGDLRARARDADGGGGGGVRGPGVARHDLPGDRRGARAPRQHRVLPVPPRHGEARGDRGARPVTSGGSRETPGCPTSKLFFTSRLKNALACPLGDQEGTEAGRERMLRPAISAPTIHKAGHHGNSRSDLASPGMPGGGKEGRARRHQPGQDHVRGHPRGDRHVQCARRSAWPPSSS